MFDYIIVGAGSAGCVLADRLSADGRNKVLVVEAGPRDRSPFIHIPMGMGRIAADPRYMWHYAAEPEPATGGRQTVWLRGKTLGGSSSVNGMVYARGNPADYDRWETDGATGWGWSTMKQAFLAIEDHELGATAWRGSGGPLPISIHKRRTALSEALLDGCARLGTPRRDDINGPDQHGVGYSPQTVRGGRRYSTAKAFLKPAMRRPNLTVVTDALVEKILIEKARAVGVRYRRHGAVYEAAAAREVVLAAGTIGSPKILQLSGIGAAGLLASMQIPMILDRPGVGENLSEHKGVWLQHRIRNRDSLNISLRGWRLAREALRYSLFRTGPLAEGVLINGFIKTHPALAIPDAQISFFDLTMRRDAARMTLEPEPGFLAGAWQLQPLSRGSIRIKSPDPAALPEIRPNFLTAQEDRRVLVAAFRYLRAVMRTQELAGLIDMETAPGSSVESDEDILTASHGGENAYHATGTCRMGSDRKAVTDPQLRVRGIAGLRVADCSVMPTQVSSGAYAASVALGWRAGELIAAGP